MAPIPLERVLPRRAHGERHPKARLTNALVLEIRRLRKLGGTYSGIARELGVSKTCIRKVDLRQTWRHVGEEG